MVLVRDELIYMAKVCEQTERFDDMLTYMKAVITEHDQNLSEEERNLLSVAYKNSVGSRRTAWRVLVSLEGKEDSKAQSHPQLLGEYKAKIEKELETICNEIIGYLDTKLIPAAQKAKAAVPNPGKDNKEFFTFAQAEIFFMKMKGDYYRYLAEFNSDKNKDVAEKAQEAYTAAWEIATKDMKTTDPIRLGLALNFSVHYYEVRNDSKKACELAKKAFDEALADIELIAEENYKDSTTIMQLIRDNLTLWNSEMDPKEGDAK